MLKPRSNLLASALCLCSGIPFIALAWSHGLRSERDLMALIFGTLVTIMGTAFLLSGLGWLQSPLPPGGTGKR